MSKLNSTDELDRMKLAIQKLLEQRELGKTICPSEAAKYTAPDNWRSLMDIAREAGRQLREEGKIEITQKGKVITANCWNGPIRFRKKK